MQFAGTFDTLNQTSNALPCGPGESIQIDLTPDTFTGTVYLERMLKGGIAWERIRSFTSSFSGVYKNPEPDQQFYRLSLRVLAAGEMDYVLAEVAHEIVKSYFDDKGNLIATLLDDGRVNFVRGVLSQGVSLDDASNLQSLESVLTGASPVDCGLTSYQTRVTTGGTAGDEALNLNDAPVQGQRKLITLIVRTNASDVAVLNHANFSQGAQTITAIELDAVNEYILAEFRGTKWEVISASAGVVTAS